MKDLFTSQAYSVDGEIEKTDVMAAPPLCSCERIHGKRCGLQPCEALCRKYLRGTDFPPIKLLHIYKQIYRSCLINKITTNCTIF